MRHYETIFIINPELSDEDCQAVIEKFQGILTDGGCRMIKVDLWGRRRLAYTVKKHNKGVYVLFEYGGDHDAVAEMERLFKIDEQVIRFLTVKVDDKFDEAMLLKAQQEAESKSAAKAEAPESEEDDQSDEDEDENQDADSEEDEADEEEE